MLGRILVTGVFLLSLYSQGTATTHFVSKTGNGSTGASWANAWTTIAQVNSGTASGDTVVFGSGIWRGGEINAIHGTAADRTCYIDSGFYYATPTTYPTKRVAWIYGSDSLSGWTLSSGNVYVCTHTPASDYPSLFQGNQVLYGQSSLASVNAAGKWYYDGAGHVYAWAYGGGDPDNYDMEILARACVNMGRPYPAGGGQDCVSIVGLGFKFGDVRIISNSNNDQPAGWDTVLVSHCYMSNVAGWGGVNPSLLYNDRAGIQGTEYDPVTSTKPDGYDYNRVVACSLGTCYSWTGNSGTNPSMPQSEDASHGNSITFYGLRYSVVDSNVFFGHQSEAALYFKCANDGADGAATFDTVRYNVFGSDAGLPYAIRVYGATHDLTFYGNIIKNASAGFQIGYYQLGWSVTGRNFIYNNTFYNCGQAVAQYDIEARGTAYAQTHNQFKWNIIYRTSGTSVMSLDNNSYWDKIDSNLYYAAGGTNTWDGGSWAAWNTAGFDTHNSFQNTNPNFVNAASGDFSRTGTISDVMNLTYGGKTWTRYGAIQTALTTPHISASPGTLTYTAALGGSNPANQTISISNGGVGTLTWSVSSGASWLSVSPASGSQTGTVTASVNIAGLAAGTYNANITISATGADNTPLTVPVTLTITRPHIVVNPTSLSFAGTQGASNPASKTIALSNSGGGTMSWTTSSGASWLSVSPASGSNAATLTASVNLSGVVAGNYNTNITITATGADNTPLTVPVSLSVAAVDNTAPTFTNVSGNGLITSTSSVITWTTNEPATSQVRYGLTASYGQTTTLDPALVTSHSVTLSGLTADTVYHFQVVSSDASGNQGVSGDNTFRTPKASSNLALGKTITVSGTYSGYSSAVINDGVIAATGGTSTTWASDQSTAPHWIDINLGQTYSIRSVRIYWATNTASGKAMRSLQYTIQTWNGSAFNDLVTVNNPTTDLTTYPDTVYTYDSTGAPTGFSVTVAPPEDNPSITSTGFPTVSTSRIRIYQPGNMGPESYPAIMWVTEVEIYSEDTAPPTAP